jgi:hypothetical protein
VLAALVDARVVWEGTEHKPGSPWRHSVRLRADDPVDAINLVMQVLAGHGEYDGHRAELVVDADGEPWPGAIDQGWEQVDWTRPALAALSALQRTVIYALLDDHEPVWTILPVFDEPPRGEHVEEALMDLEARGLVDHRLALSFAPDDESDEPVPWWALTNRAWDLLGIIKSPRYRP